MREKYNREKQLKILIDYIKKNTEEENQWINITTRKAAKFLNVGQSHATSILKMLKKDPHIKIRLTKDKDQKGGKKSFDFKYENTNTKKKEVSNMDTNEKFQINRSEFKNINDETYDYIETILIQNDITDKLLYEHLRVINALFVINRETYSIAIKDLSDILFTEEVKIKSILKNLFFHDLINDDLSVKTYDSEEEDLLEEKSNISEDIDEDDNTEEESEDNFGEQVTIETSNPQNEKSSINEEIEQKNISSNEKELMSENEAFEKNQAIANLLLDNLKDFKGFVGQFQEFFNNNIQQLEIAADSVETKTLKSELEAGNKILTKYIDDNSRLREENASLKDDIKKEKLICKKLEEVNEKTFTFMQERFEIFISEIINLTSDYVKTPQWKITPELSSSFQNNILKAVTATMDDIVKNNEKNCKTDDEY